MNLSSLNHILTRLYRIHRIIKYVFPTLTVLTACFLLAGFPAFLTLITTNNVLIIGGQVKAVMSSGIALFLFIIGSIGLCMWPKSIEFYNKGDYKRFCILVIVGAVFLSIATLGLMVLFNYAYG